MSTRGLIVFTSSVKTVFVYKGEDSYPSYSLRFIAEAIQNVMGKGKQKEVARLLGIDSKVELFAKEVLEVDSSSRTEIMEAFAAPFNPDQIDPEWDLEWTYVVDLDKKTVNVFGGGYSPDPAQAAFKKGVVDPLTYIKKLYPECQERETERIREQMQAVEKTGFKINPKRGTKRKKLEAIAS
jgi:hypothetical protein